MDFLDKQIAPPKSWEKFEDLTRALFAVVWKYPLAQKNGRVGQPQNGVDVYGTPSHSPGSFHGVQCKGKNRGYRSKATIAEFDRELEKAEGFDPALAHWTFATTASNDGSLQKHARNVCESRVRIGKFPVAVIGWETILALLSENRQVIEEFYPEHAGDLADVVAALRQLPSVAELVDFKKTILAIAKTPTTKVEDQLWLDVTFDVPRDLGPALMGRPLGPADVGACPVLPEAATLFHDLERAGSARLAGVAGAGKSICALQTAKVAHLRGWRVVRLANPNVSILPLTDDAQPTLHLVDDAHLTQPGLLLRAEQAATSIKWILSTHTITDQKTIIPGTIQLDAKRAVSVIAAGLRTERERTFRAVRSADDRIGDGPGDERLEDRLAQAEEAEFPWQFCFILGGGWRRAKAIADTARVAGADLILAAAAIRQLASRDARCSHNELMKFLAKAGINADIDAALEWLVAQRLLVSSEDLRCPHQRLAAVLLNRVLDGQDKTGRDAIGAMFQVVLADSAMPLTGLHSLLSELSLGGEFGRWTRLINPNWLDPLLLRIWSASDPANVRAACWLLDGMGRFVENDMALMREHRAIVVGWLNAAIQGTGYAIGRLMNHVQNTDAALAREIVEQVDPAHLANAINQASHGHASELAEMISMMGGTRYDDWKEKYLKNIDRASCLRLVGTWPEAVYLSAAADFCKHFIYVDTDFGLDLIEALIPAIARRISDDPIGSFHELDDIVWHSLRLFDPLGIYVGKLAATARMRTVGRKLCARWSTANLAAKVSATSKRDFQSAAGLLSFVRKVSPKKFAAVVTAIDWEQINATIGDDWEAPTHDAEMLFGIAYGLVSGRPKIVSLIAQNEARITILSPRLAAIAPEVAYRHVQSGRIIGITSYGHSHWDFAGAILANFTQTHPELIDALLKPHETAFANSLSQPSPTFYNDALLFLRIQSEVSPASFQRMLSHIDTVKAEVGWANALRGRENNREPGSKTNARQVAALLIHHAIERTDSVGALARRFRERYPAISIPSKKSLAPLMDGDDLLSKS